MRAGDRASPSGRVLAAIAIRTTRKLPSRQGDERALVPPTRQRKQEGQTGRDARARAHVLSIRAARYPLGTHLNAALRRRDNGNDRCYPRRNRRRRRHPRFPAVGDSFSRFSLFRLPEDRRSRRYVRRRSGSRSGSLFHAAREVSDVVVVLTGTNRRDTQYILLPGLAGESELARARRAFARARVCVWMRVRTRALSRSVPASD